MPTTDTTGLDTPTATEDLTAAYEAFLSAFPAYSSTEQLNTLRATEYARLDQQRQVYLYYTGGGVYAEAGAAAAAGRAYRAGVGDVALDQFPVLDGLAMPGDKIVEDDHPVAGPGERLGGVAADIAGAARDEDG